MIRDAQMKAYLNQQREIRHQEAVIEKLRSFNREKSIKRAESREKNAGQESKCWIAPQEVNDQMHLTLEPERISGNDVLTVENLSKSYPPLTLFSHLDFQIKRGEKVAIIGNNGTGKTTILKILNGLVSRIPVPSGWAPTWRSPTTTRNTMYYIWKNTVRGNFRRLPNMDNTRIRNVLAAFLFTGDDVFKRIKDLSGGERGRVSLAKLMLSEANFLILDEPTNHLDITSKEILESALNSYTGTVLYVSHDRYFINKTATRILELTGQTLINYIGNYDCYLEKKEELTRIHLGDSQTAATAAVSTADTEAKLDWKQQKEEQARLRENPE